MDNGSGCAGRVQRVARDHEAIAGIAVIAGKVSKPAQTHAPEVHAVGDINVQVFGFVPIDAVPICSIVEAEDAVVGIFVAGNAGGVDAVGVLNSEAKLDFHVDALRGIVPVDIAEALVEELKSLVEDGIGGVARASGGYGVAGVVETW